MYRLQTAETQAERLQANVVDDLQVARHEFTWEGETPGAKLYLSYVRGIPNHPFKLRIARYIARKLFPAGLPLSGANGAKIKVNPDEYIGHAIISTGAYEGKSLALATAIMAEEGGTFLDIGSNFGLYTCTVGAVRKVKCIAVEPSAEAFLQLKKNLSCNLTVDATLIHLGLASSNSVQKIELPIPGNLGTTRIALDDDETNLLPKYYIGCFKLDEVLGQLSGVAKIKLLKIDVEGYEMEVFKGLDLSGRHRPENIIAEFSDYMSRANHTTERALSYFQSNGYDAFTVEGKPFVRLSDLPEDNIWFKSR